MMNSDVGRGKEMRDSPRYPRMCFYPSEIKDVKCDNCSHISTLAWRCRPSSSSSRRRLAAIKIVAILLVRMSNTIIPIYHGGVGDGQGDGRRGPPAATKATVCANTSHRARS